MKISALITALQKMQAKHGDYPICLTDYNEGYQKPCLVSGVVFETLPILDADGDHTVFLLLAEN